MHLFKDVVVKSQANIEQALRFKSHDTPMGRAVTVSGVQEGQPLSLELHFFGNYDEPPLEFMVQAGPRSFHRAFSIQLDPRATPRRWEVSPLVERT